MRAGLTAGRALVLVGLLGGCGPRVDAPAGPFIVLGPPQPPPVAHAAVRRPEAKPAPPPALRPPDVARDARGAPDGAGGGGIAADGAKAAIVRDVGALRDQAFRYVARKDSKPWVIDQLSMLTLQTRHAVERVQAGRTEAGYRQSDIVAARVAADALAAFLQTAAAPAPDADAATRDARDARGARDESQTVKGPE